VAVADWPVILPAQLVRGRLKLNRVRLQKLLRSKRDCELVLVLEKKHATRSLAQNAFYFGVVLACISEYTGYTTDELHEFCKARFLPKRITLADKNGEVTEEIVIGTSTTTLNKVQFSDYIEDIRKWAAETLDLNIPNPLPLEMAS
jgi:hypothetical protein